MFSIDIIKKIKIEDLIIIFFPFVIITGPALPDILACVLIFYFLINYYKEKNLNFKDDYWAYFFIAIFLWFVFISFFSYNSYLSFIDSIIFIRFFLFVYAVYYFCAIKTYLINYVLFAILIAISFVTFDTLFQFYNYDHQIGFKGDIFNIYPSGLYGRLNGPFKDFVPGSYLSRFYFFILIIFSLNEKIFNNKLLFFTFVIFLGIIFAVIFFSGEQMSVATTLMGYFIIIIFIKKLRKIVFLILFAGIIFIAINKLAHPYYNDFVIIEQNAKHEGLIIERHFECKDKPNMECVKQFKKQPPITSILKDFRHSPYGEIYNTSLQMWLNNKITGVGLNNFQEVCTNDLSYNEYHQYFACASHPHNYYIQALTESGLPGLILFIFLVLSFFYKFKDFLKYKHQVFGIIILLILFWPIMSTGSFLKNWNMIFICYLLGITLRINSINFKNFFKNEE